MKECTKDIVVDLGAAIAQRIGEKRYKFWFAGHTKFALDGDQLSVGVPNLHFQEWLSSTFAEEVEAAAAELMGFQVRARFVIDPLLFQAARRAQSHLEEIGTSAVDKKTPERLAVLSEAEERPRPALPKPSKPNRRWRSLGDFVVGPCNRVAHAAALHAVEGSDDPISPLVIYGPVGTGKTHLLEGVYAGLKKKSHHQRVCYTTAEEFTNRFVQGIRLGKLPSFRKHYRECDALVIDDFHFLATKKASREEFQHTLDELLAGGRQVVISCDCHPRLDEDFPPELRDRLLGGAVWGLLAPDQETRLAILRNRATRANPAIPDEILQYIAEKVTGNVRELEGALNCVQHFGRVAAKPLDLSMARVALADLIRHSVRVVQLEDLDRAICKVLHLEAGTLQTKRRTWTVSHPRMLAIFLARKHTSAAYSEIGRYFGGRTHSTAVIAEKKIRHLLHDDACLLLGERRLSARQIVELVEKELQR